MMTIGVFYALLIYGRLWIPAITDSFETLGQHASGGGPLSPSDVFVRGLNMAGALIDGATSSGIFKDFGAALALVVAACLTLLAFCGITIQFVVAMVESYILVAAGFVFLGFGGSRWSAPYVERYIGLAISIGVKIMLLYLLLGTGMNLSLAWLADAVADDRLRRAVINGSTVSSRGKVQTTPAALVGPRATQAAWVRFERQAIRPK